MSEVQWLDPRTIVNTADVPMWVQAWRGEVLIAEHYIPPLSMFTPNALWVWPRSSLRWCWREVMGEQADQQIQDGFDAIAQGEELVRCNKMVFWWDGEYEGECERQAGHEGDHFDGLSWWDENGVMTDDKHITY